MVQPTPFPMSAEKLSGDDYAFFKSAMDGVSQANAVLAFVRDQLVARYELKEGDQIKADGTIVRLK